MAEYLAREHCFPCSDIPKKTSSSRQGVSHLCRQLDIRGIKDRMMDRDWVESHHQLGIPYVILRRWPRMLSWFAFNPYPFFPGCRIFPLLELIHLNDLKKLRLRIRDSRARVSIGSGLFESNELKDGHPGFFSLGAFFGLPFAFWHGGFLGFFPHQLVRIDGWRHFWNLSYWD